MNDIRICPEAERRDCKTILHIADTLAHTLEAVRRLFGEREGDDFEQAREMIDAARRAHAGLRMSDGELDDRINELDDWYAAHPETYGVEAETAAWIESSRLEDIQDARQRHARVDPVHGASRYQIPAFFCISASNQDEAETAASHLAVELKKIAGPNPTLRLCESSSTRIVGTADSNGLLSCEDPHLLPTPTRPALHAVSGGPLA